MRAVALGQPIGSDTDSKIRWIIEALREIERASNELDTNALQVGNNLSDVASAVRSLVNLDAADVGDRSG